jgi:hypothetical protein
MKGESSTRRVSYSQGPAGRLSDTDRSHAWEKQNRVYLCTFCDIIHAADIMKRWILGKIGL